VAAHAQGGGFYAEGGKTWLSGSTLGGDATTGPSGKANSLGGTFGGFYDVTHLGPIGVGGDVRYSFSHDGSGARYGNELNYGALNARFSGVFFQKFPIHPYVQGGVIEASTNYAYYTAMHGGLGYDYGVGADVDFAPHFAVRVEYSGGGVNSLKSTQNGNASLTFNQVQGGIVLWFGR